MMPANLKRCRDCGKFFASDDARLYCFDCSMSRLDHEEMVDLAVRSGRARTPEEIAQLTGLGLDEVRAIVHRSNLLSHEINDERLCSFCEERPAQPASRYCLRCRIKLNEELGKAAKEIAERTHPELEHFVPQSAQSTGVVSALAEKRRRTGSSRFDPTPRGGRWGFHA